jgi:ABC-2 type transport system permease protein
MIFTIANKEFRAILRDGRALYGTIVFVLLGMLALVTGAIRYSELDAERLRAQEHVAEQWRAQGDKNPHSAAHYGQYAFRSALPLAFFDPGVQAFEGVSIWLEAHKRNFATGRPADDAAPLARFGELSLAFIYQALLPLGILLLAYPAFAAERDTGTLRQLMATGVDGRRLFVGKFIGIGAAVLILAAPVTILALTALIAATGTRWLAHAALLLTFYAWFAAIVLAASLWVSAVASSARSALLTLLAIWAIAVFVLPRIAGDLGRILAPVPGAQRLQAAIERDLAEGIDGESPAAKIEKRRQQLYRLYKVTDDRALPINMQGIIFGIQDEISNAVYDKHFTRLQSAIDTQVDLYEAISLLSPRMALMLVSQELSGTSIGTQRRFADGAERFRRRLMTTLNADITLHSRNDDPAYRAGADLWKAAGEYRYEFEPLRDALRRCGAAAMVLLLWTLLAGGGGLLAARRLGSNP